MALNSADFVFTVEVTLAVLDVLDLAAFVLLGESEVSAPVVGVAEESACAPVDVAHFLEHFDVVVGQADALLLDDDPDVLVARRERDGSTLELVVEFDGVAQFDGVLVCVLVNKHFAQVNACVATLLVVAILQVPHEGLQDGVLLVDFDVEKNGDNGLLAGLGRVVGSPDDLSFQVVSEAVDGVVGSLVEDYLGGSLDVADLARHEAEALFGVLRHKGHEVLVNDKLRVCLPELDVSAHVDFLQTLGGRQVDGTLVLAVPASALPVGTE